MEKTITVRQGYKERVKMIVKIGKEYGRTMGATELAKEFGLSKQRIQQIATALRKKGIEIPRMRCKWNRAVDEAIKLLSN